MTDRTELTGAIWHKSTRSGAEGNCVEVADNLADLVAVCDSKDPHGPILTFTPSRWQQFVRRIRL